MDGPNGRDPRCDLPRDSEVEYFMAQDNSIKSVNSFNDSLFKLSKNYEKLSSGKRINRASDDAAGLAIADALSVDVKSLDVARRNTSDAGSAIDIASGALTEIGNIASRLSELATQAANGTLSDEQRGALQQEYSQLTQEASRIAETTQFNGINLLKGDGITAQVGTSGNDPNSQINVSGQDVSSLVNSVSSQDISSQAGAQAAIDAVKEFVQDVSQQQGVIGAAQSRLSSSESAASSRQLAESQAESQIRDVDIASELANKVSNDILVQTNAALSGQAGKLQASIIQKLLN